jgi:uncharacterized membrane protein
LIPFGLLLIIAQELLDLALLVTAPITDLFHADDFLGMALANIIAWATILIACFLAGLLARLAVISKHSSKLDALMFGIIPGYGFMKTKISGVLAPADDIEQSMFPVTVQMADGERYGFRISDDPKEDKLTVFLPGAPDPENGFVMIFSQEDVTEVDQPPSEVIHAMMRFGRGLQTR